MSLNPVGNSNLDSDPIKNAGSPGLSEPAFLAVGRLHRPHGIRGEIILEVLTDFPERLIKNARVFLGDDRQELTIRSRRGYSSGLLISFIGYDSPESVQKLINQWLFVRTTDRPSLPEGEYYHHQLMGLRAKDDMGGFLGVVEKILETGANDVLIIRGERGQEILVPYIPEFIKEINLSQGEVIIHLIPGLLPD